MRTKDFCDFIVKRERARLYHDAGGPPPYSDDPIIGTYRFCNVRREDDRVTRWITENWRTPHKDDPDLWFAMVVARLFNLPESLDAIGYPVPWRPGPVRRVLDARRALGLKNFNGAYIVSTNGRAMDKVLYLTEFVLKPLWADRVRTRPFPGDSLQKFHQRLMKHDGMGSFMAAQVVADVKYVEPLRSADDWDTWAAPGPGSARGLNRVAQRPLEASWLGNSWLLALQTLHMAVEARLHLGLHAQDIQNCLCEFDKYERARLDEGTPKQLYRERA